MPNQPRIQSQKQHAQPRRSSPPTQDTDAQHGPARAFLLDVPPEALTHITAFLEPPALLALGQVNRLLYDHVKSDNTWLRAFLVYFVRVGPEVALDSVQHRPTLRRLRPTWREEYIARYKLIRRWQRSRAPTVTHAPQWAPIGQMHLMVDGAALLTTSPVHGVVARSHALTGKKLKGFIDSRGTLAPRPTGDHPSPASVALASDGGTGKIAWGYFGGEVALTRLPNVMTLGTPRNALCLPADAHNGAVTCVEFSQPGGHVIASAAADGTVKLWETRHMRCVWRYTPVTPLAERDACATLGFSVANGTVVVGMQSGQILAWTGFKIDAADGICNTDNLRLASVPAPPVTPPAEDGPSARETRAPFVQMESTTDGKLRLAVLYNGDSVVYCVDIELGDSVTVQATPSLPSSHGRLTTLRSSFAVPAKLSALGPDHHYVVSGDKAGWVHIYDWPSLQISKSWSAHNDGGITALELTDSLLATGSSGGSITVWDALTYESLRSFSTPVPRNLADVGTEDVHALILADSHVVACVANRVMAWRVDRRLASDLAGGKRKGKAAAARYMSPKWQEQLEMKKDIAESIDAMKFSRPTTSRNARSAPAGQAREQQRTALGDLGLDETEALEYVLMLSRDEEEARQRQLQSGSLESTSSLASTSSRSSTEFIEPAASDTTDSPPGSVQEQEHEYGEPGDIFTLTPVPSPPVSPQLSAWSSRRSSNSNASHPRTVPIDNRKVQVTPPFRPEPVEAGTSPSAFSLDTSPIPVPSKPAATNGFDTDFPSISPSSSPKRPSPPKGAVRPPTAWSRPIAIAAAKRPSQPPPPKRKRTMVPQDAAEEEEMLRLALASSMAEQ